jgi:hypothetical protein
MPLAGLAAVTGLRDNGRSTKSGAAAESLPQEQALDEELDPKEIEPSPISRRRPR